MLQLRGSAIFGAQVDLEGSAEQLQEDLEASLRDCGVVATLAELIADERVLSPGKLVEAKDDAGLAQLGTNQVATDIWHVSVLEPEYQGHLALEITKEVDSVYAIGRGRGGGENRLLMRAQGARMDVCGEVADCGRDTRIQLYMVGQLVIILAPGYAMAERVD